MTRGWLVLVAALVVFLVTGCRATEPDLEIRIGHAVMAPLGVTTLVAEVAGVEVPASWAADAGVVGADSDGSALWIAPAAPGTYLLSATYGSGSASAEVVVAPATESAEVMVGVSGGELVLAGGERVSFGAGALSADALVRMATFDVAPADYGVGVSRIGPATQLTLDGMAIDASGPGITFSLPSVAAIEGSTATLVEIRIALRDGGSHVQLESYSPLSSETSLVTIPAELFAVLDEEYGLPDTLSVVLQPLDIGGAELLAPSAIDYVTGLFKVDLAAADFADAAAACGSGAQSMPSWIAPAVGSPSRQPVVLVTGWQVLVNLWASLEDDALTVLAASTNPVRLLHRLASGAPRRNPAYCGWAPLIQHLADIGLGEHADLYLFGYDSERHVGENAALMKATLEGAFGTRAPIIVAHSMGGLVTDAAHFQGFTPKSVLTLGTPYRGSLALSCTLSDTRNHRCLVGEVHPLIGLQSFAGLAGVRTLLVFALTSYQGTRDLTWDDSFWVKNAFLTHIHQDTTRDMGEFTSFYGDLRSDNSGGGVYGLMQAAFFGTLGHTSDGIVSENSGSLDFGEARGPWIETTRSFVGLDHTTMSGGSDRTVPPSCGATQADPKREKACEVMRAVGAYLLERVVGVSDDENIALASRGAITGDNGHFEDGVHTPGPSAWAIDGDLATYWAGLASVSPQRMWVTFDTTYAISRVVIHELDVAYVTSGVLEYHDGSQWRPLATIAKSAAGYEVEFSPVEAYGVRLSVTSSTAPFGWYNRVACITELEVYTSR